MTNEEKQKELDELGKESQKLFQEYLKIHAKRIELKKILSPDMNCECDDDRCVTVRSGAPIGAGDTHSFCHDDQDGGTATVRCNVGQFEVVTSAAVYWSYVEIERKTLNAGEEHFFQIPGLDPWHDQTNRVQITGKAEHSEYNLEFRSWDL
jgi:hypothetical protein